MSEKTLSVNAISHGTVIDHIPAGKALHILKLFDFGDNHQMTLGLNLNSKTMGRKDLIKLENIQLDHADASKIAVFAPEASVNIIADFTVKDKFKVTVPDTISDIAPCPNSNCISRRESIKSRYYIFHRADHIVLKCHYCEKHFKQNSLLGAV